MVARNTSLFLPNPGGQEQAVRTARTDPSVRFILAEGGFGSGKSRLGAEVMAWALEHNRCVDGLAAGTTYQTVDEAMIPALEGACFRRGLRPKMHEAKRVLELRELRNPRSRFNRHVAVYFRSAERAERIEGINVGVIWADERGRWRQFPSNPKRDGTKQLKGRLRDRRARRALQIDTGTPEGTATATYEEYHEKPSPLHRRFTMPTGTNASNLEPGFIEGMRQSYDAETLLMYEEGIPIDVGAGFAFAGYGQHNRGTTVYREDKPLIVSFDFGTRMAACHFAQVQGEPPADPYHVLGEVTEQGSASTHSMMRGLEETLRARGILDVHEQDVLVFGDASGDHADTRGNEDDWIIVFRALGEMFGLEKLVDCVPNANPSVRQSVLRVRAMCKPASGEPKLLLPEEGCDALHKDLRAVQWDSTGKKLDKGPDGMLTHAADTLRYPAFYLYPPVIASEDFSGVEGEAVASQAFARTRAHRRFDPFTPTSSPGVTPW